MADTNDKTNDPVDPDTLSDADFMKLDVPPAEIEDPDKKEENSDADASSDADKTAADLAAATAGGGDGSEGADAGDGEGEQKGDGTDGKGGGKEGGGDDDAGKGLTDEEKAAAEALLTDEEKADAEAAKAKETKGVNDDKETLKLKDKEPTDDETKKAEKVASDAEAQTTSDDFFKKVSAPFKADGKEIQVRTPEEAIRLMQMGVNYSRRMKEMKPLREMSAMLEAHGLNDPAKLNELVDLSKGGKEAISKFLKSRNIDPLDLDMEKADAHSTPNYQADPVDVAFKEAIDNTLAAEGGKELLADVNKDWDNVSKESLRENPSIFQKLLDQKESGVYAQINTELLHQRTMGYLADTPFLQAYEEVGNAMQKAGVFDKVAAPQKKGLAPIDTGSRKSAPKKKTEPTNPNLSSAPKSRIALNDANTDEPDFLSMSDADFMKLAQPS